MMLSRTSLSLRALALTALVSRALAGEDVLSVLAKLESLSDDELMKGTEAGARVPFGQQRCPAPCSARNTPSQWTIFSDFQRFSSCVEPMLFDFAIYNPLDDPTTDTKFRVCTVDFDQSSGIMNADALLPRSEFLESTTNLSLVQRGILSQTNTAERTLLPVLDLLRDGFLRDYNETLPSIMFSFRDDTVAAVYAGTAFDKGAIPSLVASLTKELTGTAPAGTVMAQLCGGARNTKSTLGAIMSSAGDISLLQNVVKAWLEGTCASLPAAAGDVVSQLPVKTWESFKASNGTLNTNVTRRGRYRGKRADKPQKNSDGTCAWGKTLSLQTRRRTSRLTSGKVTTKKGDNCSKIGDPLGLTPKDIDSFNVGKTWGWKKCESLLPDLNICLSDGL